MEIPKDKIDLDDPEVKSFLDELVDIAQKLRSFHLPEILENWDEIQGMKERNPKYWHISK